MAEEKVMVDVVMTVYNHEKYVAQAIHSVLDQKADFKIRLKIFNDCSTDGSDAIIREVIARNRTEIIIDYVLQPSNVGMMENGMMAFKSCSGKYVAICEGDDYWTDEHKLQKQVGFLEQHPDFSIVYHKVLELDAKGKLTSETLNRSDKAEVYTQSDLAAGNLMHTPSVVYRKKAISERPVWFVESPVGDYVLSMLAARQGKIRYFPEAMAVYRRHESSGWSSLKASEALRRWLIVLRLLIHEFSEDLKVQNILISQFEKRFLELRSSYLTYEEVEHYTKLVETYIKDAFFQELWLRVYEQEMKLLKEPPVGIKNAVRFLFEALRKRLGKLDR